MIILHPNKEEKILTKHGIGYIIILEPNKEEINSLV